jgi:AcrR family transcriptional regulator
MKDGTASPRPATREKREQILRAAVEIFGNKGSANGTLADVAEQVGMTHADRSNASCSRC